MASVRTLRSREAQDVWNWLGDNVEFQGLQYDARLYMRAERPEEAGNAEFIIISEGPLSRTLNMQYGEEEYEDLKEGLDDFLEEEHPEITWDLINHYTVGFYRRKPMNENPKGRPMTQSKKTGQVLQTLLMEDIVDFMSEGGRYAGEGVEATAVRTEGYDFVVFAEGPIPYSLTGSDPVSREEQVAALDRLLKRHGLEWDAQRTDLGLMFGFYKADRSRSRPSRQQANPRARGGRPSPAARAVWGWVQNNEAYPGLDYDAKLYMASERPREAGQAEFIIMSDGPLTKIIRGDLGPEVEQQVIDGLDAVAAEQGLVWEPINHYTFGFYQE
jgi:hypothetical protein